MRGLLVFFPSYRQDRNTMKKNTGIYLLLSLIGVIAIFLWMRDQGAPLKTYYTPRGILDLEFAFDGVEAASVKSSWHRVIPVAQANIYIDFLFIIAYTSFLTLGCRWMSAKHSGKWGQWGARLSRIVPVAGIFDVAENALMLLMLDGTPNNYTAMVTTIFAIFKFVFAAVALLYILISLPLLLVKRERGTENGKQ